MSLSIGQTNFHSNLTNKKALSNNFTVDREHKTSLKDNNTLPSIKYPIAAISGWLIFKEAEKLGNKAKLKYLHPLLFKKPEELINDKANGMSEEKANQIAEKMLQDNGLKDKIKIRIISESTDIEPICNEMVNAYKPEDKLIYKIFPEDPKKKEIRLNKQLKHFKDSKKNTLNSLKHSPSGVFFPRIDHILTSNSGKFTLFHEIGHAINKYKFSALAKLRFTSYKIIPLTVIAALIHNKKDKNPKEKSFMQKTGDFINNHIGSVVFAVGLPHILEEMLASKHGLKYLNGNVDKSVYNSIRNNYARSSIKDTAFILVIAAAAKIGVYAKNKLVESDKNYDKSNF